MYCSIPSTMYVFVFFSICLRWFHLKCLPYIVYTYAKKYTNRNHELYMLLSIIYMQYLHILVLIVIEFWDVIVDADDDSSQCLFVSHLLISIADAKQHKMKGIYQRLQQHHLSNYISKIVERCHFCQNILSEDSCDTIIIFNGYVIFKIK